LRLDSEGQRGRSGARWLPAPRTQSAVPQLQTFLIQPPARGPVLARGNRTPGPTSPIGRAGLAMNPSSHDQRGMATIAPSRQFVSQTLETALRCRAAATPLLCGGGLNQKAASAAPRFLHFHASQAVLRIPVSRLSRTFGKLCWDASSAQFSHHLGARRSQPGRLSHGAPFAFQAAATA
jgi:hypothetical protein